MKYLQCLRLSWKQGYTYDLYSLSNTTYFTLKPVTKKRQAIENYLGLAWWHINHSNQDAETGGSQSQSGLHTETLTPK
jgi:hypothetical protein